MIDVKLECHCGQQYAFDVEPVEGRMPTEVQCPNCGSDGTAAANAFIARLLPPPSPAPSTPVPKPGALRISSTAPHSAPGLPSAVAVSPAVLPPPPPPPHLPPIPDSSAVKPRVQAGTYLDRMPDAPTFSLGRGIIGGILGAILGSGLLIGLSIAIGFRFPLFGVITGYLTGIGARTMARGTDNSLGAVASVIALLSVSASFFILFGQFSIFNLVSLIMAVASAWRVASG